MSCGETREYKHPMMVDPERCISCNSDFGLVKKISASHVVTSNKSGSGSSAPNNSEYIDVGIIHDPRTGESSLAGTTREIRRDGTPFFEADLVGLISGEKLGTKTLIDIEKL